MSGYVCSEERICVRAENAQVDPITSGDASTPREPKLDPRVNTDAAAPDGAPVAGARATGNTSGSRAIAGIGPHAGSQAAAGAAGASGNAGASGRAGAGGEAGENNGANANAGASGEAGSSGSAGSPPSAAGSAGLPPTNRAGAPSAGSMSEPGACATGTRCDDGCVELATNPAHCGACDRRCDAPLGGEARCEAGVCAISCTAPLTACGDACVDVMTDVTHCGGCDAACNGNRVCERGACIKPKDATGNVDVGSLRVMLAVFGVSLEEFAESIGVPVSELDDTEIALSDLGSVGITVAALALLGFSEDALEVIGIDIDR